MADIGGHAAERLAIFQKLLDALKQEIDVLDADGRPCYTDVCEWFAGLLGTDGHIVMASGRCVPPVLLSLAYRPTGRRQQCQS